MARKTRRKHWIKRHWKKILGIYILLLIGSHVYLVMRKDPEPDPVEVRNMVEVDGNFLAYREWGGTNKKKTPIILLHGSPGGGASDFRHLGPELAEDGRRVIAVDRWGFGESEKLVADYSFDADAAAVLMLMDQLDIGTAHLAGWSYGAGPAIVLAEQEPGRIRSVTMIAGIGMQEGEGSGNYLIEHGKYGVALVAGVVLPELVPHYGLLGTRTKRYAFGRDFWDCDQRKLKWQLQKMDAPLLLLHGKNDFLVPAWVAQEHRKLKPTSRLVVLDASHFFPFGPEGSENLTLAGAEMRTFLAAAEQGKTDSLYGVLNETSRQDLRAMWDGGPPLRGYKPWWLVIIPGIIFGFMTPRTGSVLAGLGAGWLMFDWVTGVLGVVIGTIIRRGESTRPRKALLVIVIAAVASIPALLTLGFL